MAHETVDSVEVEFGLPVTNGDMLRVTHGKTTKCIELDAYVDETGLVRYTRVGNYEQEEQGVAAFTKWLKTADAVTIRRN